MKNKKTYYQLILDRSGSMSDCIQQTISGFNEQVQMICDLQKKFPEQKFYVSLATFNQNIEQTLRANHVDAVKKLTTANYVPDGMTALLDAIGETVISLKTQIENELRNDEATVVVVILTDGYENASRIFNWQSISGMIKELEATTNWTFSFLGSTFDAVDTAARMNIKHQNAVSFNKANMNQTFEVVSDSLLNYAEEKSKGKKPSDFLNK